MKRLILVLSVVLVFGLAAYAQEVPKVELFLGYEYIRFSPSLSGNPSVNFNGGGGAVNFNITKVLGIKAEFTGATTGGATQTYAGYTLDRSANFFTYLFGPQFSYRGHSRVVPFAHLLFGGSHSNFYANLTIPVVSPAAGQTSSASASPTKEAFTLAVGGGIDVKVAKHVALRLGQFDYFMTRFSEAIYTSPCVSPGPCGLSSQINNQNNFRYMGGIVFRIGRKNILPPTVTCSAVKSSIIQGDTTTIQAKAIDPEGAGLKYTWTASGGKVTGSGDSATFDSTGLAVGKYTVTVTVFDGKYKADCTTEVTVLKRNHAPTATVQPSTFSITQGESVNLRCIGSDPDNDPLTYSWSVDGQRLAAAGPEISFGSEGRQPGNYTVTCTVSDGEATGSASATGTVRERIKPNQPPTVECLTTTVDVASGGTVELRARASDPDGDKLSYTWSATGGSVSGTGETATFNAAGVKAGSYIVTVTVDDGRGGKASCSMTVNVSERLSVTRDKCGFFTPGGVRLDNCAKAILDDLAVRMKNDPKLRANVIGYRDRSEGQKKLGEQRAKAVAAYLEKRGVESSQMAITDGGTNNPMSDGKTAAGRKLNRRVEIELTAR